MNNTTTIKSIMSIAAFIAAILIGFIALFIPPTGIIDSSVLWFTSQLLVFVSGLLGINISIDSLKKKATTDEDNKTINKE